MSTRGPPPCLLQTNTHDQYQYYEPFESHVQRAPAPGLSCGSSGSSVPRAATPGQYLPDFFSGFYVPRAEEGDPGKAEVLMRHEDPHRDEVWLAEVVYEAADIAVETGIYAVHLSILEGERLHVLLDEGGFYYACYLLNQRPKYWSVH